MSSIPDGEGRPGWLKPAARNTDEIGATIPLIRPGALAEHGKSSEETLAREWSGINFPDWRYDHGTSQWMHWNKTRWREDATRLALELMRRHIREASAGEKRLLGKASFAKGMELFAQIDQRVAVEHDIWDADDWLLQTPAGIVDLRTGAVRQPDRSAMLTRCTSIAPAKGEPKRWLQFMREVTSGDNELARYLQRVLGYSLTGSTREHAMWQLIGDGGNGKSVLEKTVTRIMGDYAVTASMDTFTASKGDRHPTDLARLDGARLVAASETTEGRAWDEARIKQLTGGDRIAARYMRQDFFEFTPRFKLLIIANHAPVLHNVDEAMRRRFNIIPFNHKPPEPDRDLEETLAAEHPQILAWLIDGARQWHETGLRRPETVNQATEHYFAGQDILGQWLDEHCEQRTGAMALKRKAFENWTDFARFNGHAPGTQNSFSRNLEKRGIHERRTTMGRFYNGLDLVRA